MGRNVGTLFLSALVLLSGCAVEGNRKVETAFYQRPDAASIDHVVEARGGCLARIASDPSDPEPRFELGMLHLRSGELGDAELRFREVVALSGPGRYTGPHYFLGLTLALEERVADAVAELESCVAVVPTGEQGFRENDHYRKAHYLLAGLFRIQGNREAASAHLGRYVEAGGDPALAAHWTGKP